MATQWVDSLDLVKLLAQADNYLNGTAKARFEAVCVTLQLLYCVRNRSCVLLPIRLVYARLRLLIGEDVLLSDADLREVCSVIGCHASLGVGVVPRHGHAALKPSVFRRLLSVNHLLVLTLIAHQVEVLALLSWC